MDIGKVKESVLKRSVLKAIKYKGKEVVSGPGVGNDAGVLSVANNNEVTVTSTNTVTFNFSGMEPLAIAGAVNGICAKGGKAQGVELTILLPVDYEEPDLRIMMHLLDEACKQAGVSILGGHTQVCTTVSEPVISVTAIGRCVKDQLLSIQSITPGMDIVVSKWIAMAGTEIILDKKNKELCERFQSSFLEKAKKSDIDLIGKEAAVAVNSGVAAMHDVSLGGITGALWEMASAAGVGLEIEFNKIPVRQETIEICELFGLNPYEMISTGSLLMITNSGNELVSNLQHQGINAVIIGRTTAGNDRVIIKNDEKSFLTPSRGDEIFKIV